MTSPIGNKRNARTPARMPSAGPDPLSRSILDPAFWIWDRARRLVAWRTPAGRKSRRKSHGSSGPGGFTLIELILVMSLLVIAVAVSFPSLQGFFRGRSLASEARRFLSLIRNGQSRAVTEGVPMVLWVDPREGTYGLQAEAGYLELDSKAVEYELDNDLQVEVSAAAINLNSSLGAGPGSAGAGASQRARTSPGRSNLPALRFSPDGSLVETSPEFVQFQQTRAGQSSALWVAQTPHRLTYEIRTTEPQLARR